MPETPIIPHRKTNQRLLFSLAGGNKLIAIPSAIPLNIDGMHLVVKSLKFLAM